MPSPSIINSFSLRLQLPVNRSLFLKALALSIYQKETSLVDSRGRNEPLSKTLSLASAKRRLLRLRNRKTKFHVTHKKSDFLSHKKDSFLCSHVCCYLFLSKSIHVSPRLAHPTGSYSFNPSFRVRHKPVGCRKSPEEGRKESEEKEERKRKVETE